MAMNGCILLFFFLSSVWSAEHISWLKQGVKYVSYLFFYASCRTCFFMHPCHITLSLLHTLPPSIRSTHGDRSWAKIRSEYAFPSFRTARSLRKKWLELQDGP